MPVAEGISGILRFKFVSFDLIGNGIIYFAERKLENGVGCLFLASRGQSIIHRSFLFGVYPNPGSQHPLPMSVIPGSNPPARPALCLVLIFTSDIQYTLLLDQPFYSRPLSGVALL